MAETIPCPGCGTALNLSDTGCPICLRGRSPQEITRTYARLREQQAKRRRRPFVALGVAAAVGLVGYLVAGHRDALAGLYRRAAAGFSKFYDDNSDAAHIAPNYHADEPAPAPTPSAAPAVAPPAAAPAPLPPPPIPAPARKPETPAPRAEASEPPLPPVPSGGWALHGRVFDLKTLQPVANAQLVVKIGDVNFSGTTADGNGFYAIILTRLASDNQGYGLEATDPRYAPVAQYEGDIPYARLSSKERARLMLSAQEGDYRPSPLTDVAGEPAQRRDVYLSPRR